MNNKTLIGINDMWTVRPDIAKLLKNADDGYKYTAYSSKRAYFVCPECETIHYKTISNVSNQGLACNVCGDGISYPNKFARNLLKQLKLNVKYEWQPDWIIPYYYDNYFEYDGNKYIVEMDGRMGHGNAEDEYKRKSGLFGLELDAFKDNMAAEHGIIVIRIDCAYKNVLNRFNYVKQSIKSSELNKLFDLSNIDWDLCNQNSTHSEIMIAADMYLQGETVGDISKILQHGDTTIVNWLKIATNIGKCNYDPYESRRRSKSKDIGYTINQYDINGLFINTYMSAHDINRKIGIPHRTICHAIQSKSHKSHNFLWYKADDPTQPDKSFIVSTTK